MNATCPACAGEGGRVTWLNELGDEEFVWCRRCNGHGFIERGEPAFEQGSNTPLSESEPFDQKWERMERHDQESLSRLEQP